MTILAGQAEETGMNGGLSMALDAFRRCTFEHFILMTRLAFNLAVHAFQREKLGVIKIFHPIHAIVAIQTA